MCWWIYIYHSLGRQFQSPTINVWFTGNDFIKFCNNPVHYLTSKLEFFEWEGEKTPSFKLDDIKVHMPHVRTQEEGIMLWEKRKRRVKLDDINVGVLGFSDEEETLKQFSRIPFSRKVCVVPFQTEEKCALCVDLKQISERSAYGACLSIAKGKHKELYHKMIYMLEHPQK